MLFTVDLLKLSGALPAAIALTSAENVTEALAAETQASLIASTQAAVC
jgi:hypothetical protein